MRRSSDQVDELHALHAGSGPHDGPRCRCRHDGVRWLQQCEPAAQAAAELHAQAQVDYRRTVQVR